MTPFLIEEIADTAQTFNGRLFPLQRAEKLQSEFAKLFSSHLGCIRSGEYFESEVLVVTGKSGSGKTAEIESMMKRFNASNIALPSGRNARMVSKELDRKGGWKDLGKKSLHAMGYPIQDKTRHTQTTLWERVATQGKLQGVVAINYDEVQHILAGKEGLALEEVLDSFKSILKSKTWPFLLVLSGVPELADKLETFEQLFRKVTHVTFDDLDYDEDASTIHEMLSSYTIEARLDVADDLNTNDFIHRLATAGAFRWGMVCQLVIMAIGDAKAMHSAQLSRENFVNVWADKTKTNKLATPFTHESYDTIYRCSNIFKQFLSA
jgi:hypothetical protein